MHFPLKVRATAVTAVAAMIVSAGTAAIAQDEGDLANEISLVAAQADPDEVEVVYPSGVDRDAVSFESSAYTEATIPLDSDTSIVLESKRGGPAIEIALPGELLTQDGEVTADGSVVFVDDGSVHAHAVVQSLADDSVRVQTVLDDPDAPTTYSYDYGVLTPFVIDDGSVELLEIVDGVGAFVVGTVDAPWAFDSEGRAVPTHYTVQGNTLVQHVAHNETFSYPITADPKTTRTWWNTTVYFNRSETRNIAYGVTSAGTLASWIPWPPALITGRVMQTYGIAFLGYWLNGKCGKLVGYGHVSAPVPQQYSGSEAGRYCR